MFAVFEFGGKQYKIENNTTVDLDFIVGLNEGDEIKFDKILLSEVDNQVHLGKDVNVNYIKGTVIKHYRDKKIVIFKKRRRKNYRRKTGHRQDYTRILITDIVFN